MTFTAIVAKDPNVAWAAGLFEGEGCFSFGSGDTGNRSLRAMITMTDLDVLEKFQSVVGMGTIRKRKLNPPHKQQWSWYINSFLEFQSLAVMLWPWLCSRRRAKLQELFDRYDALEPVSLKLRIDRTADIKAALMALSAVPLWGRRWKPGKTQNDIAKEFGVSPGCVSLIKRTLLGGALRRSQP